MQFAGSAGPDRPTLMQADLGLHVDTVVYVKKREFSD